MAANVEAAASAAAGGPQYLPDDPSLPKPWKGLIDGNTGYTYYWNPETNVTQYEKPGITAPPTMPLPSGVSPTHTASQTGPQHGPQTPERSQYQQQHQYMNQLSQQQQQGQFQVPLTGQAAQQQQPAQMPQVSAAGQQGPHMGAFQHQFAQYGQGMPQRGSQAPVQQGQMMPQQYGPPQTGQQMLPQQGSQMGQQPARHTSPLMGSQALQHQGPPSQVGQSQGHPFMPQHVPYGGGYQQPLMPQGGQQNAPPYSQHMPQGPPFSYQQENRNGIPPRDDADFSKMKQTGSSVSQYEQSGHAIGQGPPSMNLPNHSVQAGPLSGSFGSSVHMHQPASSINLQEKHNDAIHPQQTSVYPNQMKQPMMHTQQHAPPIGSKMGYDENQQGRAGQGYNFNSSNDVPVMTLQHPKLAVIPTPRKQQDMMMGGFPHQNAAPSRDAALNPVAAPGMHSMYKHGNVDMPMSNHNLLRPPPMVPGSADVMSISSVEAYRQQHEVTATGENVPAPFMTFEATGFPPELLREVRYLLRWGAYVVRCTDMRTIYMQQVFL